MQLPPLPHWSGSLKARTAAVPYLEIQLLTLAAQTEVAPGAFDQRMGTNSRAGLKPVLGWPLEYGMLNQL